MMECKPWRLEKKAHAHEGPETPSVHPSSTHIYVFRVSRLLRLRTGKPPQTRGWDTKATHGTFTPNPEAPGCEVTVLTAVAVDHRYESILVSFVTRLYEHK